MKRSVTIFRNRTAFVLTELPIVIAMLCLLAGAGLCFSGRCAAGGIVAVMGLVPLALLFVPPLFRKGR